MTADHERDVPWWCDAVIYQIYPRSFADENGDGVGDLAGIIARLDYIADLGVDAIWLSPIFVSPMADFGYDVADYCRVDPLFGTNDDLDALIAGLHARGMRLLLDWVPNHTSDQHEWFVESRASRESPRRDWYVWRDRSSDGSPPNNWMATFKRVSAWTHDPTTDQSYLHLFLAEQPDLNWANPDVERAMHDALRFWLDRGVDGFRADVVHLIGKGDDVDGLSDREARHVVLSIDRPLGHELLRRIRTLLDSYPQRPMMVGEVYLLGPGQTASYLGGSDEGTRELHLTFDFRPLHTEWNAVAMATAINGAQAEFSDADGRWPTWVLSNHDQPRHRTRFGTDAAARAAAVLSLTMRATPFLYAGEELGLQDAVVPSARAVDPGGRDGCRAPIPWSADGAADRGHGWSAPPWLPFPANATTHAVDAHERDSSSTLHLYRRLLALRRSSPCVRRGAMSDVRVDGDVIRFDRSIGDERMRIAINFATTPHALDSDEIDGRVVLSTDSDGPADPSSNGVLSAQQAIVIDLSPR